MEKLAEVVELPPVRTPGWSSLEARVPHKHEVAGSNPAPDFVVHVPGWFFWLLIGWGLKIMADRIANAWGKIKANRQRVVTEIAEERKKEREAHAADIAELRAQIEADGLSDADRQAIVEMETEAAGG